MSFVDAVKTCLTTKYATFEGRAARSEYWYFSLFYLLMLLAFAALGFVLGGGSNFIAGELRSFVPFVPMAIVLLAMMIPTIAVTVRRLHDRDMSGWWYLGFIALSFIPVVGKLINLATLVLYALKGTAGPNRFGRDPLGVEHNADIFA
ncbi:MAG: DUF805 domain-containing protein [Pseudomonadota bacterium]